MESWFEAGALSRDEFEQLVRLTARYVAWDVDQFDHWAMPTPEGAVMYVDFNQGEQSVYPTDGYRTMWPTGSAEDPRWTLWRQDDNGNRVPMRHYGNEHTARSVAEEFERRGHKQMYWVEPPETR